MTIREWKAHKADMALRGVCDLCPLKTECDGLGTDYEAAKFVERAAERAMDRLLADLAADLVASGVRVEEV